MNDRMSRTFRCTLAVGIALLLFAGAGCDDEVEETTQGPSPTTDAPSFSLPEANTAFAFDLYVELRAADGNLFLSPYSVSAALAMTLAGARAETAFQMSAVLHYEDAEALVDAAFGELEEDLASRTELADTDAEEGFDLHVVNALWPQTGYELLEAFVERLTVDYGAGLRELDYEQDPEAARQTINDWVADETAQRIQDLIPAGVIDTLTRLVLTNAIYFNAPWLEPFTEEATAQEPFHLLDGTTIDVPMMHKTETLLYSTWDGGVAVEIPYNGAKLAMTVLLPDDGSFEAFEASLTADLFGEIVSSLLTQRISLGLPRFEFDFATSLVPALQALGMTDAFDGSRADFSGITGERDLAISDVLHKAFVSVDEVGTEAAAATAVVFRATAAPTQPMAITVDRPFLFVIRDRPTGSILFLGRVLEP